VTLVQLGAVAVETIAVGLPEDVAAGKQNGAVYNRAMGVPEEEDFGKKVPRILSVLEDGRRNANREDW